MLVDTGTVEVDGVRGEADELLYVPPGATSLTVRATDGDARLVLIGGQPLGERVVMWWNFIGRDHDEITEARRQWQAQIGADDAEIVAEGDPSGGDTAQADLGGPDGVPDGALPGDAVPSDSVPGDGLPGDGVSSDGVPGGAARPAASEARFGSVTGHPHPPLPAPPMPHQRLKARG